MTDIIHRRAEKDGSSTILESYGYEYDANGNITKITNNNGEYTDYTHDALNRLTSEERKTAGGDRIYKIEYKFDNNQAKNGNIHQVVVNETDAITFAYNEMNQLTGITKPDSTTKTLTYDDNGNLTTVTNNTTGETTVYEWDCHDRMTGITLPSGEKVDMSYDSDGMLVAQSGSGVERKFVQNNRFTSLEMVKGESGEWITAARHTIINSRLMATRYNTSGAANTKGGAAGGRTSQNSLNKANTTTKAQGDKNAEVFYHTDHLGSVRLVTDKDGNIITTN